MICFALGQSAFEFIGTRNSPIEVVDRVGLEPTANALKGHCSTTELPIRSERAAKSNPTTYPPQALCSFLRIARSKIRSLALVFPDLFSLGASNDLRGEFFRRPFVPNKDLPNHPVLVDHRRAQVVVDRVVLGS